MDLMHPIYSLWSNQMLEGWFDAEENGVVFDNENIISLIGSLVADGNPDNSYTIFSALPGGVGVPERGIRNGYNGTKNDYQKNRTTYIFFLIVKLDLLSGSV